MPSMIDSEHGQDLDAEWYMVQHEGCKRLYHFYCARVDTKKVHSKVFADACIFSSGQPDRYLADQVLQVVDGRSMNVSSNVWKTNDAPKNRSKKNVYGRKSC